MEMFLHFGRDFSSDVFFVEMFLQLFGTESFLRDVLVEIVLLMFIWQGMCLQSSLGIIFRDNLW